MGGIPNSEFRIQHSPVLTPHFELIRMEHVDDPFTRHLGTHRDGAGVGVELEVGYGVGVRGEADVAAAVDRETSKIGIEILATRKTVDLDRDSGLRTRSKDLFPPSLETGAMVKMTPPRVSENVHSRGRNRAQQAVGLIPVGVEAAVHCRDDAVNFEALPLGNIERPLIQHLHFESLKETVLLSVELVPFLDPATLKPKPFAIETGCDLETTRMIGHHRPGEASFSAGPRHRLDTRFAVRIPGVPVTGASESFREKIRRAASERFGHLSS